MSLKNIRKYEHKKSSFLIKKFMILKTLQTKNSKKLESNISTAVEYYINYHIKQHILGKLDDIKQDLKKYHHFNVKLLN